MISRRTAISVLVIVVLAFVALNAYKLYSRSGTPKDPATGVNSHLDAILSSGEIRASYLVYSPYFRRDPNTGELSGIFHDIMEEVGRISKLKINWVEDVGYETIFTGLDAKRYDVFAGGLWPSASRVKEGSFSIPVFYSVIKAWGRKDETRFEGLNGIDSSDVVIATIDGAMEDIIAKADYPNAKRLSLPQLSPFTQNLLNVVSMKADLTFAEPGIISEFLKTNPGTLKELAPEQPLRIFGNTLVLPKGDMRLKEFIDVALRELLFSGQIDKILRRYETVEGAFPRVALPYDPKTAVLGDASR